MPFTIANNLATLNFNKIILEFVSMNIWHMNFPTVGILIPTCGVFVGVLSVDILNKLVLCTQS